MKFACAHCGEIADKPPGAVNRARNIGANLYCGKVCAGLGRRKGKTKAQKVEEKRAYDIAYRAKNLSLIKAKKHAHFVRTYDPAKAAIDRKRRMPRHVEYCRRPEYRAWKRDYDRKLRAQVYGAFAEAFLLLQDIDSEVNSRITDYDTRMQNGTINKWLKRRREYEKFMRYQPQASALGDAERDQERQDSAGPG